MFDPAGVVTSYIYNLLQTFNPSGIGSAFSVRLVFSTGRQHLPMKRLARFVLCIKNV